jgi:hypothetical protein
MLNLLEGSVFTFSCDCGRHSKEATLSTMTICNAEYKGPIEGARLVKLEGESLGDAAQRLVKEESSVGREFRQSLRTAPNLVNLMECWEVELPMGLGR